MVSASRRLLLSQKRVASPSRVARRGTRSFVAANRKDFACPVGGDTLHEVQQCLIRVSNNNKVSEHQGKLSYSLPRSSVHVHKNVNNTVPGLFELQAIVIEHFPI